MALPLRCMPRQRLILASLALVLGCSAECPECAIAVGAGGGEGGTGGDGGSGDGGGGGPVSNPAADYCDCMLLSCHDQYHATYGPDTDEVAARQTCLEQAAALPVAGMAVDAGNFVECRLHHCEAGKTDVTACPASVGLEICN